MERMYILGIIHKYIKEYKMYKIPSTRKKAFFAQSSYARWAVKKCLQIAVDSDNPRKGLEEFAEKMEEYACLAKGDAKFCFSVAYDIVTDILCMII